jgi:hypothetical protein
MSVFTLIKAHELSVKSVLGLESDRDNGRRLSLAAAIKNEFGGGTVAVVPGGLDQESPGVSVAGLGDGTASFNVTGRMLRGDKAKVGHETCWRGKARDIIDLAHKGQGSQRLDTPEAAESLDLWSVGHCTCSLFELGIEGSDLGLEILQMLKIN